MFFLKNKITAFWLIKYFLTLLTTLFFIFVGYFVVTGESLYYAIFERFSRVEFLEFGKVITLKEGEVIVTNLRIKDGADNYLVYVDLLPQRGVQETLIIDLRCLKIVSKGDMHSNPYVVGSKKSDNYTILKISGNSANPTSVVWQFEKTEDLFEQFIEKLSGQMHITYGSFVSGSCIDASSSTGQ